MSRHLAAIEAIAGGRYDDAARIVQELQAGPRPAQRGICRYCGCTEARGCAILLSLPAIGGEIPDVVRCEWVDDDCTVCSNVSCIERWRRDSPAEIDVDVHDASAAAAPQSRIVLP